MVRSDFGERHPLVISCASGLPLFSPSIWLTAHRRTAGLAVGTLANNAQTLASVYNWAETRGIRLDERFLMGDFLSGWEVSDLAEYLRAEIRTQSRSSQKVVRFRSAEPMREPMLMATVTPPVGNYRLDIAASFLYWLSTQTAHRLKNLGKTVEGETAEKERDEMASGLRCHKQTAMRRNSLLHRQAPEPEVITRLLEVVKVDHPDNPWADPPMLVEKLLDAQAVGKQTEAKRYQTILTAKLAIRLRNKLIVHLLFHLGLRRGEMLGLKARDLRGSFLWVLRHPDDPEEIRQNAPNTKTRDRKLSVNSGLQIMWLDYVSLVREKFPLARKHPYVIVNHRDGNPLCFPGLAKIFDDLGRVAGLPKNLTPHHLRHAWNDKFSDLADEQDMDEAREVQIRAELMGWNPGSPRPTAMAYLRRKTKRRAQDISLQLQEDMMHPKEGNLE